MNATLRLTEQLLSLASVTPNDAGCQALLADRLRSLLAKTSLAEGAVKIHLPASFGVAELLPNEDVANWFKRVDAALYRAKAMGRNTTVSASPDEGLTQPVAL